MKGQGDRLIALIIFIDDIMETGNNEVVVRRFNVRVVQETGIKDLGQLKYFLECR